MKTPAMLCDTNVWIALSLRLHDHHAKSRGWFDQLQDTDTLLFCRATQQAFLRLMTNQAVFAPLELLPLTDVGAWSAYDAILSDYRIALRDEPATLEAEWRRLTASGQASPKRWMDAYLAAFCIAGGYRLVTFDSAFQNFPGLDVLVLG